MLSKTVTRFRKRGCPPVSACGGFTLIEVVIAMTLAMIIFAGGFGALAYGTRLVEISRDETRASQILQSEIEDLRTFSWAKLILEPTSKVSSPQTSFSDTYADRYSIKREIAARSATQKQVTVKVSWTDNRGTSHTREYMTLVTQDGLYDFYYRSF
jgi:type II secretory pathway pseudopilin PulG